ncbi:DUF2514 family protein [Pseudomonas sp. CCM 7891]|uniref:DUF2514 family protein n=1 Tax=Pseudomonas karstica TaxID=1055468 RepID=A0A7X2RRH0_9PSED|nr:DUF2514 domain-containing protein [Pseudomonas karstica]MTD19221.1 DUF2514 family protein [Pseudomonas karstica]
MNPLWLRILPYIAAVAIVLVGLFMAYGHGQSVTDAEWQVKWSARDTMDATAKAANESTERAKEQARQQTINKVIQDGQQIIDQATADASTARASAGSLQLTVDRLTDQLSTGQAGVNSCTTAASQAATRAVMVFADVLKRADQRAGDLAADADQGRSRGVTCERAYEGLGG